MKSTNFDQSFWQKGLHLFTLFTIAVAHPVLDLTARNPAFYVARKSEPFDLLFLVFALCFIIPGLFLLIEWLLGHRKIAGRVFHGIIFFLLCASILTPALKKATDSGSEWILPATILLAATLTFLYFRIANVRSSITFLSPALLIAPLLFFINPRINRIVRPSQDSIGQVSIHARNPVVMIIFDEFPLKSLLDDKGDIDAALFPNFDKLSRKATWYRNATTVAGDTIQALPAILTGNYPKPTLLPNRTDYPRNLVSLLENNYEVRIDEFITGFSPATLRKQREPFTEKMLLLFADLSAIYLHHLLPEDQAKRLPVITQTWGHFWEQQQQQRQPHAGMKQRTSIDQRARKFRRFIASINKSKNPHFYFLHAMLPHVPWQYFPSGTQYNSNGIGYFGVDGLTKYETWIKNPAIRELSFKRHLLQVEFVDRLLGELIQKLKREKMFDQTLLVVLSDHGASFHEGTRRAITKQNFEDIARIPLFIKVPFQKHGGTTDINAQIIDVVPTIQKALQIDCDWKMDGQSLLTAFEEPEWKTVFHNDKKLQFPARAERITGFKETDPEKLGIAIHPEWIGKNLTDLHDAGDTPLEVRLHNSDSFNHVDLESGFIPALVTADLNGTQLPPDIAFGIVVNGKLCATTRAFAFGRDRNFISSLLPESSFQAGVNDIEIVMFSNGAKKEFLRPRLIREKGQPLLDYTGGPG